MLTFTPKKKRIKKLCLHLKKSEVKCMIKEKKPTQLISSTYTYPLPTYTFPTHTATPTYTPPNPKMLVSSSNIFYIFQFSLPTFPFHIQSFFTFESLRVNLRGCLVKCPLVDPSSLSCELIQRRRQTFGDQQLKVLLSFGCEIFEATKVTHGASPLEFIWF